VALDYKRPDGSVDTKRAPRVSASGRGAVAEQILEIAFAKGIPVREDPDLAQILAAVEVDSVIPVDALAAVAEILSYLYRANGKAMDGETPGGGEVADSEPETER
jgi:flagellar biosynthesis protein